jgi:2-oxoglutarate dehydrogenase E2 component (dihydrolipoamide succinyltransferase)
MQMPQMGESIAEATILKWLKAVGDTVEKDETILEISTDKVDSEIPSPASGQILEIRAQEGETVAVKSVIAIIGEAGESAQAPASEAAKPAAEPQAQPQAAQQAAPAQPQAAAPAQAEQQGADRFYSPLVRSLAAQQGLSSTELSGIPGSGSNGRVTKEDVISYLQRRNSGSISTPQMPTGTTIVQNPAAEQQAAAPMPATTSGSTLSYGSDGVTIEPFNNMRRIIADHMVRSKATSPHVYSMAEIDVTNVAKWRQKVQGNFVAREGFKLSFTPFFLEAAVKALGEFPRINASVQDESLIIKRDVNLGCAVALGRDGLDGLIVPVIKNASQLNLAGLARALNDVAARARDKKLSPDDIQGGTFTVTNPGVFGNIIGCPIINQPQLAILGLGAIKKRPMVVNDAIAIRQVIILTLAYDHRVIDGAMAGQFLRYITQYLEGWNMERTV